MPAAILAELAERAVPQASHAVAGSGLFSESIGPTHTPRDPGSVQDCPHSDGGVVPACPAPPQEPRPQLERLVMPAPRTPDPLRPSASGQVQATRGLVGEKLPKLVQRPRILRAHRARPYPLALVESTG
jgi:hypothetical protein